jgi:hypothetical protein
VKRFYSGLSRPVTVDFETTDYTLWFHALMQKLGHTLLVGGPQRFAPWSSATRRRTGVRRAICSTFSGESPHV